MGDEAYLNNELTIKDQFVPNWKPPLNMPIAGICLSVYSTFNEVAKKRMPDLLEMFPFNKQLRARIGLNSGWVGLVIDFNDVGGTPCIDNLTMQESQDLSKIAALDDVFHPDQLHDFLGNEYFTFNRFSYIGPWDGEKLSWLHMAYHMSAWMDSYVVPEVLHRNASRVLRVIPSAPSYNFEEVNKSLWVLECEESMRQGAAFYLENVGLVTCEHVLGPKTIAFRSNHISDRRSVQIKYKNADLDLAVLEIEGEIENCLPKGLSDNINRMDNIAIFGFPNYRLGDSGVIIPGLVVGFRPVSGITRILTNAPIVAGASGSPALNANGMVIGVAATGADRMEDATNTEHHSIIPIDALKFLFN